MIAQHVSAHHMTSHCITWHDTTQAITPHQITWAHITSTNIASKQVTSPPWNSRRLVHSKDMVWASRWSVALRTFYRQILSLLYSSFFLWNFRPRLARELLVKVTNFQLLFWGVTFFNVLQKSSPAVLRSQGILLSVQVLRSLRVLWASEGVFRDKMWRDYIRPLFSWLWRADCGREIRAKWFNIYDEVGIFWRLVKYDFNIHPLLWSGLWIGSLVALPRDLDTSLLRCLTFRIKVLVPHVFHWTMKLLREYSEYTQWV